MSLAFHDMTYSKTPPIVTPGQIRAARALLRITGAELADHAKIHVSTIRRFEDEEGSGSPLGQRAMKAALETMGVEFIGLRGVILKNGE